MVLRSSRVGRLYQTHRENPKSWPSTSLRRMEGQLGSAARHPLLLIGRVGHAATTRRSDAIEGLFWFLTRSDQETGGYVAFRRARIFLLTAMGKSTKTK